MLFVDELEVLEWNLALFRSFPLQRPFMAFIRGAPQINYLCLANLSHRLEAGVQRFENLVLTLVHVAQISHEFRKNVFICKYTSLRYFDLLRESLDGLMKFLDAGEDGVDLEGESPPCWFLVVLIKHVDVFFAEVLPFRDRLLYPLGLRHLLPQDFEEGGLSTPDVSFDGIAVVSFGELRVEGEVVHGLIQVCRQVFHLNYTKHTIAHIQEGSSDLNFQDWHSLLFVNLINSERPFCLANSRQISVFPNNNFISGQGKLNLEKDSGFLQGSCQLERSA